LVLLLTKGQARDHRGAALLLHKLPPARERIADQGQDSPASAANSRLGRQVFDPPRRCRPARRCLLRHRARRGARRTGPLAPPGRITKGELRIGGRRGREIGAIFQAPLNARNPLYTIGRQLGETTTTHLLIGPAEARRRAIERL
jgi:hypothetical protein